MVRFSLCVALTITAVVLPCSVTAPVAGAPTAKAQFASLRKPDSFKINEPGITDKFEINPLEAWRAKQFPEKGEDAVLIAQGRELFKSKTCQNCHAIRGHGPMGVTAPDLTHFGARSTLAAGLLENNPEQLQRWIHNPGAVKPGNKMQFGITGLNGIIAMPGYQKKDDKGHWTPNITLTADDEVALVAYLQSLK